MSAGTRLAGFALVLVLMVGGGALVGRAVGPIDVGGPSAGPHGQEHSRP